MNKPLPISFDPAKSDANLAKPGVALSEAEGFDFETALIRRDTRADYGEARDVAIGMIGARLHVLVFTMRGATLRVISLRKANRREINLYDQA